MIHLSSAGPPPGTYFHHIKTEAKTGSEIRSAGGSSWYWGQKGEIPVYGVCLGRVRGECGKAGGCHHRQREWGSQSSTVLCAAVQIPVVIVGLGGAGTNSKRPESKTKANLLACVFQGLFRTKFTPFPSPWISFGFEFLCAHIQSL